jgi:hypothetical protein
MMRLACGAGGCALAPQRSRRSEFATRIPPDSGIVCLEVCSAQGPCSLRVPRALEIDRHASS